MILDPVLNTNHHYFLHYFLNALAIDRSVEQDLRERLVETGISSQCSRPERSNLHRNQLVRPTSW